MIEQIGRIIRIVAASVILWIVAVSLPPCLLYYLDFGPTFINIIARVITVYFIVIPVIALLLLIIDLIQFVIRRRVTIVNQAWYLSLSVFAIFSISSFLIMYNSLSEYHVFDPLWSSHRA
jgi:hypothetical protein